MWNIKQNIKSYGKQGEQLLKWGGHSARLEQFSYLHDDSTFLLILIIPYDFKFCHGNVFNSL